MTTTWTLPTQISQYPESGADDVHVAWDNLTSFTALRTVKDLQHIARSPKTDVTMKTWFLKLQGFNFNNVPDTISGIELRLTMNRRARITDDTVQLVLGDTISDTRANLNLDPVKVYGSDTDLWNTKELTSANIMDPTFGVLLRFQSHPHWPHKDGVYIGLVEMRIH